MLVQLYDGGGGLAEIFNMFLEVKVQIIFKKKSNIFA